MSIYNFFISSTIGFIALAGNVSQLRWSSDHLLLQKASRINTIDGWNIDHTSSSANILRPHYYWLDSNHILYEVKSNSGHMTFRVLNTSTLMTTNARIQAVSDKYPVIEDSFSLSPDQQWALWRTKIGKQQLQVTARLDGTLFYSYTSHYDWYHERYVHLDWQGDQHRYLELIADAESTYNQVKFRTAEDPQSVARLQVNENCLLNETGLSSVGITQIAMSHVFRYNHDVDAQTGKLKMNIIDLSQSPLQGQQYFLNLPTHSEVYSFSFNKRHPRIAMLLATPCLEHQNIFWHHFLSSTPPSDQWHLGLWVSDWYGRLIQEVGHISISKPDVFHSPIRQVEWASDNKHLSFIFNRVLYKVPVNEIYNQP